MGKTIIDILFLLAILIGITYHYIVVQDITIGEFYIGLMLNYIGARYLLMSNIDYAIYEALEEKDE